VKGPLGKSKRGEENNIKMELEETFGRVEWIHLAQNRD
jgi:hypothetical protein